MAASLIESSNLCFELLKEVKVCDFSMANGSCPRGSECSFIHGSPCPNCKRNKINPFDEDHLINHAIECEALQSQNGLSKKDRAKQCSICLQVVWRTDSKCFGVLSECSHVFCLTCISQWRSQKDQNGESKIDCPLCRQDSAFIYPSRIWPASQEQKTEIEKRFMAALKQLHCKFFDFGRGHCILGERCIYKHQDQSEVQI